MSLEFAHWCACAGKQRFKSQSEANKATRKKSDIGSYRCQLCGFWHIGHKVSKSRKETYRKNVKRWKKSTRKGR